MDKPLAVTPNCQTKAAFPRTPDRLRLGLTPVQRIKRLKPYESFKTFRRFKPFNSVPAHAKTGLPFWSRSYQISLFRSGVGSRRIRKRRLDDFETGNVGGCVHVQKDRGVAEELLDAEVEHHAVASL